MTFAETVYKFLQVDHLQCDNCGRQLSVFQGYRKLSMWPQYAFFTWRWLKQLWFGDNNVLRFCFPGQGLRPDGDCLMEFTSGRLGEIEKRKD